MNRKEFISSLGVGAAFALTATCLGACTKNNGDFLPSGLVDFTVDLANPANARLLTNGGYLIKDRVVVARTTAGTYVAATQRCSHEGLYAVVFSEDEWYCPEHGARFSLSGSGLNRDGSRGLTIYQTTLEGDLLRVFS